jgi:hypothetical protein
MAALVPDRALTIALFEKHARVGRSTVIRRFGNWAHALQAAGLANRLSENVGARGAHPSRRMTDNDVLRELRELAVRLGKTALTVEDVKAHLPFSGETLRRRWGSSRGAFEAAGLSPTSFGRRYTGDECFENLLNVWTRYARPPKYREMGLAPSRVGGKAYIQRFGTWNKTLAAFVERANREPDGSAHPAPIEPTVQLVHSERSIRDGRDIPLGLRFQVLRRDMFKCVLCGDNPPRNSSCVLHVDHVILWSREERRASKTYGRCVRRVMSDEETDIRISTILSLATSPSQSPGVREGLAIGAIMERSDL